jgi:hypothetical protein
MADLGMDFDPMSVEPDQGRDFDMLPPGKYVAEITESDVVETKSGTGRIMKLTFTITEGQATNRKVWANINYINASADAQRIGMAQVSAICHAIGHQGPLKDTAHLHGIPMLISLGIDRDKAGQYADKNKITGYAPVGDPAPAAPRQAAQAPRQAPQPATTRPTPTARPAASGGWPARAAR